jgi:hypothetical protein
MRATADYDEAIWLKNGDYPAAYYNRKNDISAAKAINPDIAEQFDTTSRSQ